MRGCPSPHILLSGFPQAGGGVAGRRVFFLFPSSEIPPAGRIAGRMVFPFSYPARLLFPSPFSGPMSWHCRIGVMGVIIEDLEACGLSGRFYGGRAGRKIGIAWRGADWLVKFPGPTGRLEGGVRPSAVVPVSEWLGSHVYGLLDIPVHETVLGVRDGRIVCACKDFADRDHVLVDFHDLKNSLSDAEPGFVSSPSAGSCLVLADVVAAIGRIPVLRCIPGVSDRFWDMFVIDAFTGRCSRDNTDWGVLRGPGMRFTLAPVYANGDPSGDRRTGSWMRRRVADRDLIRQDALDVRSCYVTDTGHPIAPLKYMASGEDPACTRALARFMDRFDPARFDRLLGSIPSSALGLTVVPDGFHEYHRQVTAARYREFTRIWKSLSPAVAMPGNPTAVLLPAPFPDAGPSPSPRVEGPGL